MSEIDTKEVSEGGRDSRHEKSRHIPVLFNEVLEGLDFQPGELVIDGTLGAGGHSRALAERIGKDGLLLAFDKDSNAIKRAQENLESVSTEVRYFNRGFEELAEVLEEEGVKKVNKILFDLGLSSDQLAGSRGMSFQRDEPLVMSFSGQDQRLTGRDLVNQLSEEELVTILRNYGGERFARRISEGIKKRRTRQTIETTAQLVEVIMESTPSWYHRRKIHPATKTFQALRIATNDEIGALEKGLEVGWKHLARGGRLAVIAFHSLEDRTVKNFFQAKEKAGEGVRITKKPIVSTAQEMAENPRSRSAKLRIIERY